MRKLIGSLIILISLLGLNSHVNASVDDDPSVYLEKVATTLIGAIEQNKQALKTDSSVAEKLVKQYLLPVIDTEGFSKRTLGSTLWKSMTDDQQNRFIEGYINQVINKYAKGLSLYDGQAFKFEESELSKSKKSARVRSQMKQTGAEDFKIEYYLSRNPEGWMIYNIIVEGVDMKDSYSKQFHPRINEIGMDKFLKELAAPRTPE